jgi:glycyl-tRNA synthetase (class II)
MAEKKYTTSEGFLVVEAGFIKNKEVLIAHGHYETLEEAMQKAEAGTSFDYRDMYIIPAKFVVRDYDHEGVPYQEAKPYPPPPANPEVTS